MKKFELYCGTSAVHGSKTKGEVTLEELGFTPDEWEELTEEQQEKVLDEAASDFAWNYLYYGWTEEN